MNDIPSGASPPQPNPVPNGPTTPHPPGQLSPKVPPLHRPDLSAKPPAPKGPPVAPAAPPPPPRRLDEGEIRRALPLLCEEGATFEVRILGAVSMGGRPKTLRGFFTDPEPVIRALRCVHDWSGVYATLNPPHPALKARCVDRFEPGESTKDGDIVRRTRLLLDFDVVRPSGVSSSEDEHKSAIERARSTAEYLTNELGWPEPAIIDSGNGAHLWYAVDLPSNDDGQVKRTLVACDILFSDKAVKVDTSVHNPSRIVRLPGTLTCKGDSIPDRPHRLSRVISAPAKLAIVSQEKVAALIACATNAVAHQEAAVGSLGAPDVSRRAQSGQRVFDVPSFLERAGIVAVSMEPWSESGARKWVLDGCPMDDSHERDKAAFIVQFPSGALSAGCHHERCGWGWRELRERYDPRSVDHAPDLAWGRGAAGDRGSRLAPGTRVKVADGHDNIGTIMSICQGAGEALVHFVSPDGVEAEKHIRLELLTPCGVEEDGDAHPRPIKICTLQDLQDFPRKPWVLPQVLRLNELAVMYGAPACAKTFVAVDLACHLALGIPWHAGGAPRRPQKVLYVCAEGGHEDVVHRVCAWFMGNEGGPPDGLFELVEANLRVIPEAVQLVGSGDLEGLLIACREEYEDGEGPALVVFDTLARCSVDVEENSSKEMGRLIARADWLRSALGTSVLLVHHEGKDSAGGERGSSALRGASDLMIQVTKGGGKKKRRGRGGEDDESTESTVGPDVVEVTCNKAKRQKPFPAFSLSLTAVSFGVDDADGEPMGSAWLKPVQRADSGPFTTDDFKSQTLIRRIVGVLRDDFKSGEEPATGEFLTALEARGISKRKLYRVRTEARNLGVIDWGRDKRSTRWKLGPNAVDQTHAGSAETPELFAQPDGPTSYANDSRDPE